MRPVGRGGWAWEAPVRKSGGLRKVGLEEQLKKDLGHRSRVRSRWGKRGLDLPRTYAGAVRRQQPAAWGSVAGIRGEGIVDGSGEGGPGSTLPGGKRNGHGTSLGLKMPGVKIELTKISEKINLSCRVN